MSDINIFLDSKLYIYIYIPMHAALTLHVLFSTYTYQDFSLCVDQNQIV